MPAAQNGVRLLELAKGSSGDGLASGLSTLTEHLGRLVATESSTPGTTLLVVLVGAESRRVNSGMNSTMSSTHKLALAADTIVESSRWSSLLTSWRATTAEVFL